MRGGPPISPVALDPGTMSLSTLLVGFVRRNQRPYALAALMLATISVLTVSVPRRVGTIVDALVAQRLDQSALMQHLGWLVATGLAIYFLRVGWRLQLFKAAYQFGVSLRTRLYQQLSVQGPAFYQRERTGNLMALATNDIDAIEMVAGEAMLAGFDGSLTLALVLASMFFAVDWRLTLIALVPFPFMAYAFWRISNQVHHASATALTRFGVLNDHAQESLTGVRTVRALGMQRYSAGQFARLADDVATADLAAQCWEAAYEPAVGLTLSAAAALTLAGGGYLVWHAELSVGALTSFSMYLTQLIWPMFAAGWVLSLFERARAAWRRLQPVLDAPATVDDDGSLEQAPSGSVRLQQVGFRYPGQVMPALSDFTLTLTPGMTLGVVGATGSGKSTLLRLLMRHYAADSGSLTWGVHPLSAYQLATLRSVVSWVPQEAFLFSASIADNIALARPGAAMADIRHVAQLAAIDQDILRWPDGYATAVGERGVTLSGGQRQRVALARALLADSALLLLDDALSAVDTVTESRILQHLQEQRHEAAKLARPRTVVIATHRLSAVANADHIVVLRSGRIVAAGTHVALLQEAGWYAAQWRYQQLEASLDAL
ncbi:MAG: SmdA family multidrug ABC transporter permease/ATP-binding protein [Burkholderiaceae bacterium]